MVFRRLLGAVLGLATMASAAPIIGNINVNGGTLGSVKVTLDDIDFQPPIGGGVGGLSVVATADGYFTGMEGDAGLISDLNRFAHPVGVDLSLTPFMGGFTLSPGLVFYLGTIEAGIYPACVVGPATAVGTNCTPDPGPGPGSPFNLRQESGSVTAQLSVFGTVINHLTGDAGYFRGSFTTQITASAYNNIGSELLPAVAAGTLPNQSWSANFESVATPEPSSFALIGLGLVAAGLVRRRHAA